MNSIKENLIGKDSAFVTLATDDKYSIGALVLAHSLKKVATKAKLVVIITKGVSENAKEKLSKVFDSVENVAEIDSKDEVNLSKLDRPELGITFTKIHCWKLTQFSKCVFLDADTLVLQNCDELFDKSELSAVPDIGWPDCFNSGMFVFQPSDDTFSALMKLAKEKGSFDGGDQGLLNMYFSDWATKDINTHLSFIYNMTVGSCYSYLPAFEKYKDDVKIVHFLGSQKPWIYKFNKDTGQVENAIYPLTKFLKDWWQIFTKNVDDSGAGIEEYFKKLSLDCPSASKGSDIEDKKGMETKKVPTEEERKQAWEQGKVDYLGVDSFKNIEEKLDKMIDSKEKLDKEQKKKK